MKSPNQARPKSTPKPITYAKGYKPMAPMCTDRVTTTSKTTAKVCSCEPKG